MLLFLILYFVVPAIILLLLIGATSGTLPFLSGSWNETMLIIGIIWVAVMLIRRFRNR